jgi:hypothetical protein
MALKFSIDFITKFLSDNGDETLQQKWADETPKYKKLFKKAENKSLNNLTKGPKKNKSAYNIYCSQNISLIKEELPDLDNKAIFSEMAKRWKNVKKTADFDKYQSLAQEDKDRYTQEKDVLNKDKKPSGPKKSKTGYMIFCDEERPKILDIKGKELLIELGKRWQLLKKNKDKRLQAYQKLADEDKQRYNNEKATFADGVVVEQEIVEDAVVVEEKPKKKKKENAKKEVVEVVVEPVVIEPVVEKKKGKKNSKK